MELMKDRDGLEVENVVESFFASLDFPRVVNDRVIKKAIVDGISNSVYGITSKTKIQTIDGKITVSRDQVTIGMQISEDEVDRASGFIVSPAAIPPPVVKETITASTNETEPKPEAIKPTDDKKDKLSHIIYKIRLNRSQLYKSYDALANLADKTGILSIKVEAESKDGIDRNWLRNAVEEPIEESGADIEEENA